jgi:hypothetical protein
MQLLGNSDSAVRSPFEMINAQRLIKFPMFCGNHKFIAVFTTTWKRIMDHMNPTRSLTRHILDIHINILIHFRCLFIIVFLSKVKVRIQLLNNASEYCRIPDCSLQMPSSDGGHSWSQYCSASQE